MSTAVENNDTKSAFWSIPTLRHRHSQPDVPEDVAVALLHLNDPNWEMESRTETMSIVESLRDEKGRYTSDSFEMGRSHRTASEYDSESQTGSRKNLPSMATLDYEDESPYAEVRAAVSNTDDPNMPVNTFRMWFLGLIFTILISGLNQFFSMRYPSVYISALVVQLVSLPCGKFLERVLPTTRYKILGCVFSFNPGPFNIKEHTLITVMANVVSGGAYATDVIATQRFVFNQHWGFGYQIMLCLSSQIIGFAFAGMVRQFLVWPAAMIWPGALVNAALFNTLHRTYGKKERGHMSREKFFLLATVASFVWYWFPGYIFTALSIFNWVCWIAPNNIVVNQLFGYQSGLGMGFLTFDWAMISFVGSPLVIPWWAQVNTIASFVTIFWIITPILYYRNVFFSAFIPITGASAYDNTGSPYRATNIIQNGRFDPELYKAYSPPYIPITFVMAYAAAFASMTALIVHTFLWYRHDIKLQLRRSLKDNRDIHSRLMAVYPEVPHWWYAAIFVVMFALSIVSVEVWETDLPGWALVIALIIAAVFVVPIGMIRAITNQQFAMQLFGQFVAGYMLQGRPTAVMIFKTYSFIAMNQALSFLNDLKLGHYMKVPPRMMFLAQVIASVVSIFVVVFAQAWMFSNIPDICTPEQKHNFICPSTRVFSTAALLWGGIGPARLFNQGHIYYPIVYSFLIGAILPIPFYFLARRFPLSYWRYVNVPVMFAGISAMPPANGINFSSWFMVGAFFQFFMRRFHFRWWNRYNYILSAALDSGVAIGLIVIYFALQFPKGGIELNWWGNTVYLNTADADGATFKTINEGETFGLTTWS